MGARIALLLVALASTAHALGAERPTRPRMNNMPRETGPGQADYNTPSALAPANGPWMQQAYPTPVPMLELRRDLQRRQTTTATPGSETCGYKTDAQFRPFACASGLTCTNSNNIRACCTNCMSSTFATNCLDATHSLCTNTNARHDFSMCCTMFTEAPFCATFLWSSSTEVRSVYTLYICESTKQTGIQILAAETEPASSRAPATPTIVASQTTTPATPGSMTTVVMASPEGTAGAAGAPIGAVVGGVLGGIAIVGLIVLAGLYILRRKGHHSKPDESTPAAAAVSVHPESPASPDTPPTAELDYGASQHLMTQTSFLTSDFQSPLFHLQQQQQHSPQSPEIHMAGGEPRSEMFVKESAAVMLPSNEVSELPGYEPNHQELPTKDMLYFEDTQKYRMDPR